MRPIFHITHISNLASILEQGGLWSINHIPSSLKPSSSAHANIQNIRAATRVPAGRGGVLHDYVPFYFGELSPMLFTISRGNVAGRVGQEEMIYLVSAVESAITGGLSWVFTDGHAIVERLTRFFDHVDDLVEVDWTIVRARYWGDTVEEPDRKRRKQAEFLVYEHFPASLFGAVAVMNSQVRMIAEEIVADASSGLSVVERPAWYY